MTVDYAACREALERAHAVLDPSECHGVLCGLLCAARQFPEERWLNEVLQPGEAGAAESARCKKVLRYSRRETERQLEGQQFDFEPMLPDDRMSLTQRGKALTHWCRGFLYGLAVGGLEDSKSTSEDVRDVLKDISEFTQLDVRGLEASTSALERDYAELVEYVRVGVMLIHNALRGGDEAPCDGEKVH
jgi:yecA family protein